MLKSRKMSIVSFVRDWVREFRNRVHRFFFGDTVQLVKPSGRDSLFDGSKPKKLSCGHIFHIAWVPARASWCAYMQSYVPYSTLHYHVLPDVTLHYQVLPCISMHFCITMRYPTLPYSTFHYIIYIALQYTREQMPLFENLSSNREWRWIRTVDQTASRFTVRALLTLVFRARLVARQGLLEIMACHAAGTFPARKSRERGFQCDDILCGIDWESWRSQD